MAWLAGLGRVLPNDEVSVCACILLFKHVLNATDMGATTKTTEGEIAQSIFEGGGTSLLVEKK
jgi:hypothetical protein